MICRSAIIFVLAFPVLLDANEPPRTFGMSGPEPVQATQADTRTFGLGGAIPTSTRTIEPAFELGQLNGASQLPDACANGNCGTPSGWLNANPQPVRLASPSSQITRTRSVTRSYSAGSTGNVVYRPVSYGSCTGNRAVSYGSTGGGVVQRMRLFQRFNHGGPRWSVSGGSTASHLVQDHGVPRWRVALMTPRAREAMHSRLHNSGQVWQPRFFIGRRWR